MLRCIAFDFDGVIVESNGVKRNAYFRMLEAVRGADRLITAVLQEFPALSRYDTIRIIVDRLVGEGLLPPGTPVDPYVSRYTQLTDEGVLRSPAVPGSLEAVQRLAERYPLYLNSATPEPILYGIAERRNISRYFRGLLGSPRSKMENMERIMQVEQVRPHEVVLVGDSRNDLRAAQAVGCHFVGVLNSFSDYEPANFITIHDLWPLCDVIESIHSSVNFGVDPGGRR